MADIIVRIATPLRRFTNGADEIVVGGTTVKDVLDALGKAHEGILAQIQTPDGHLQRFINIFLDDENIRNLEGLNTRLEGRKALWIITAVSGGSGLKARDHNLIKLKAEIPQVTPAEAQTLQGQGAILLDVREQDEIALGRPLGAVSIGRGFLELRIEDIEPDLNRRLLIICSSGTRSFFAAADLKRLGYTDVHSVIGGFSRWKDEGRPVDVAQTLNPFDRERYSRHLRIPEVGEAGQMTLLKSRVLLVGVGGLGSPAALYLAAAGVGTIGIIDHDLVDRSNLQRQILHIDARIGTPKTESARATLLALNPSLKIETHTFRLDRHNVEELFSQYQLIIDGSDNFPTRYLVNDACVKLGLPNIHGSISSFEGQVSVFWQRHPAGIGPCYRCIYPEPPPPGLAPSCAEAGVLGVLPGVIGILQAVEAIKLLLGLGNSLVGRMLHYDALKARFRELKIRPDPNCRYCAQGAEFPGYMDYDGSCGPA